MHATDGRTGSSVNDRPRRARSAAAMVALVVGAALLVAPDVVAQPDGSTDPVTVDFVPADDIAFSRSVEVRVNGLIRFEGGIVAIYVCGNQSTLSLPITARERDCARPGRDGYAYAEVVDGGAVFDYQLVLDGIGRGRSRCRVASPDERQCTLAVLAVSEARDPLVVAVPLDAVLELATGVEAPERVGQPGDLLGLSPEELLGASPLAPTPPVLEPPFRSPLRLPLGEVPSAAEGGSVMLERIEITTQAIIDHYLRNGFPIDLTIAETSGR